MFSDSARFLLIGPLPSRNSGRITGAQIAFATFAESMNSEEKHIRVINTARGLEGHSVGKFSFQRTGGLLASILEALFWIPVSKGMYLIISSSWLGFLKDAPIIWWGVLLRKRIVVHLHGGGYRNFYDNLPRSKQLFVKKTMNHVDRIIVLGDSLKDQFYFVDDRSKRRVVPNGVPACIYDEEFRG
jgi:hypothetical protein